MIHLDIRPRGTGKTSNALAWFSRDPHRILVTFNRTEQQRLRQIIDDSEYLTDPQKLNTKRRIFVIDEVLNGGLHGRDFTEIYFDNLDIWLQQLFMGRLKYASMTRDE
jgi:hypothetical protein